MISHIFVKFTIKKLFWFGFSSKIQSRVKSFKASPMTSVSAFLRSHRPYNSEKKVGFKGFTISLMHFIIQILAIIIEKLPPIGQPSI